ncbi:Fis family transcriptional regulator [Ruminococcaceae bacterium AM28-23LB]|nr:Fis family transcriptional regulator [Ruminococcaceae bacterium AM28-23LB]
MLYSTYPFQSTLPVGGATTVRLSSSAIWPFQSTPPVGGATTHAME